MYQGVHECIKHNNCFVTWIIIKLIVSLALNFTPPPPPPPPQKNIYTKNKPQIFEYTKYNKLLIFSGFFLAFDNISFACVVSNFFRWHNLPSFIVLLLQMKQQCAYIIFTVQAQPCNMRTKSLIINVCVKCKMSLIIIDVHFSVPDITNSKTQLPQLWQM